MSRKHDLHVEIEKRQVQRHILERALEHAHEGASQDLIPVRRELVQELERAIKQWNKRVGHLTNELRLEMEQDRHI